MHNRDVALYNIPVKENDFIVTLNLVKKPTIPDEKVIETQNGVKKYNKAVFACANRVW